MDQPRTKGATLAMMAAAGILGAACGKKGGGAPAPSASPEDSSPVYCAGVNSCAGKSERATAKYGCAARNACKGRGIVVVTAAECKSKGGTVELSHEDRRPTTVDRE
jgi:hypothetical protein